MRYEVIRVTLSLQVRTISTVGPLTDPAISAPFDTEKHTCYLLWYILHFGFSFSKVKDHVLLLGYFKSITKPS